MSLLPFLYILNVFLYSLAYSVGLLVFIVGLIGEASIDIVALIVEYKVRDIIEGLIIIEVYYS